MGASMASCSASRTREGIVGPIWRENMHVSSHEQYPKKVSP